jgi:hypothetical protein
MKKIFLFFIFGCISFYGLSVNPIDPPSAKSDSPITDSSPSINISEDCNDLISLVAVTAIVTIADCPDAYVCSLPSPNCSCEICIYDNSSCTGTPLGCSGTWNPNNCTYDIPVQANEYTYLYASFACHYCSYGNGCIRSDIQVPPGGGDVPFSDLKACP